MVWISKNGGPEGLFSGGVYSVKIDRLRSGFSQIPAGIISRIFFVKIFWLGRKIFENFSEKFFGNYFWRGKIFPGKILCGPGRETSYLPCTYPTAGNDY